MSNTRKPIKELGKFYEYLKDHELREKEQSTGHLNIRDADFSDVSFEDPFLGIWKNFLFTNCYFPASPAFQLEATTGCVFNMCEFGPGRKDVTMHFGTMKNCRFQKCKFKNGNIGLRQGEGSFTNCEFENTTSSEHSWNYFIAGNYLLLTRCKFENYDVAGDTKLHMKNCDFNPSGHGSLHSGHEYTADFILEDTRITNAEEILWNKKINNLTLRGCEVKGKFSTQEGIIRDSITLEKLKVGSYFFGRSGTEKKITVRDCHFSEVNKNTTRLFNCSADYAEEALFERVEAANTAAVDLTGAGEGTGLTENFRLAVTRNKTFTLRGCKIPHLMVNWGQTHHLVIEDCEFGTLELKDGRIGNVTIKNTKFGTLDISKTLATKFDIDKASAASGKIVTAGSNYPKGGHKIDAK